MMEKNKKESAKKEDEIVVKIFGYLINKTRIENGISQECLAGISKVSTNTLSAIENCKKVFKITTVIKVLMGLKSLNIDINNLIIEFQDIYENQVEYNKLESYIRKRIYDKKL